MVEEPESENSLFSEPMKIWAPSARSARPRRSITPRLVSRSSNRSRTRSRSSSALRSSSRCAAPRTISLRSSDAPPDQLASPAATSFWVSWSSSAWAAARAFSSSTLASANVQPRTWALRKFAASVSEAAGSPIGTLMMRFSTCPSSATKITSARSGSSRTNSICFNRTFGFAEVADLHQCVDEEAQPELGRQPPSRGVRRINEAELLQIRHHVAHGRRRERSRDQTRNIARAHGLAGGEVALDDLSENIARALVELGEAHLRRADRDVVGQ